MICNQCGANNNDGSTYCFSCGSPLINNSGQTYPQYNMQYQQNTVQQKNMSGVPTFTPPQGVPTFTPPNNSDYMQRSYGGGQVCYFHAGEPSVGQCVKCGKNVCKDCAESYQVTAGEYAGKILCYSCCEELVQENINLLAINKKHIILTFILTAVGALLGLIFGISSTGDATMTCIFVCIGATFFSFVKDFFKSIGQAFRVMGWGDGAGGELLGIFFFVFKLIYIMLKSVVVAFIKVIKYSIYLSKTSKALESDQASLQEMRDYMEYTQIAFANKGVDIDTLINQNSQLYNNTYAQNYRANGEAYADAAVRNAATRIAENGEIIRDFAA